MKTAPVCAALADLDPERELLLVHTGQHYDADMSEVFLAELEMPAPAVFLGVGSGTHGEQTARTLVGVETVLLEQRPGLVVVAGDVNSTLGAALAAVKVQIPVAHIESGLRSFDWSMPEEHNRRLTDHLSSVLFTHSPEAIENLAREGIDPASVHLVGNTMIDSLLERVETARAHRPWADYVLQPRRYGLITLHRPSLVDQPALLAATAKALAGLAAEAPLLFPLHPRTREQLCRLDLDAELERAGVLLTPPLPYLTFLGLEAEAAFVLTDSGGVQEETSALGIRCFTFRESTERPITITHGTNTVLGARPEQIHRIPELLREGKPFEPIPLWDGRAGERAAAVLARFLTDGAPNRNRTASATPRPPNG
jgi:UDP-N-acetylglucosamine 2-epimerase (non-hydrolysing)